MVSLIHILVLVHAACTAAFFPGAEAVGAIHERGSVIPTTFKWNSTGPLVGAKNDGRDIAGIKDPSIVEINGTFHVFASTAQKAGYNLVYFNFTDFSKAADAPFYYLDQSSIGTGYRAAP